LLPDGQAGPEAEAPSYVAGALLGGLVCGLLTGFPLTNCCCFLWAGLGGLVAAWWASRYATWFGPQEGALAGAASAFVGWLVHAVILVPLYFAMFKFMQANPQLLQGQPDFVREAYRQTPTLGSLLPGLLMTLGIVLVSAVVGGVVAGMTFARREPWPDAGVAAAPGAPSDDTRPCPVCAERIKVQAIKCRFCGTSLQAPPAQ
jgi:hypothetical protein